MKRILSALLGGGALVMLGVVAGQTGLLRFSGPHLPVVNVVRSEVAVPTEARIVAIEPISLDCRARVHAEVPVEATRRHQALGQTYRTDRVTLDAVGDVDTCVDGGGTTVTQKPGGAVDVVINGSAVTFVRPRVDTVATAGSLTEQRGILGKLTDAAPWVDDNLGLTPLAYAYAQDVIGGSRCMETAYAVTEGLLVDAYRQQAIDQGADPALVSVRIEGQPSFTPAETLDPGDVEMQVGTDDITCTTGEGPGGGGLTWDGGPQ